jgi:hypothetical protein
MLSFISVFLYLYVFKVIISATWELQSGRIVVEASLGNKVSESLISTSNLVMVVNACVPS